MTAHFSGLDYSLLVGYLLATVVLGLFIGRRVSSGKDYFLAGRSLPWWAIGMSLVASDIGGTDIIGVGGAAYSYGLAVGNFEWIGCVPAMIVAAFVFIPFFWRAEIYTIPEFMERRYNAAVRSALAICWLVFMACNLGIMLFASSRMMSELFGWGAIPCILATAALVGLYTVAGGLAAVVYTDMIQCVVMIVGCLAVLVIGLIDVGGIGKLKAELRKIEQRQSAHSAVAQRAGDPSPPLDRDMGLRDADNLNAELEVSQAGRSPAESPTAAQQYPTRSRQTSLQDDAKIQHIQLILPVDTRTPFPWTGILFGLALILSPAYWMGNQAIVQRSLGARSEFEAMASYVWGAILKSLIPFLIAVPGLIALVKFPNLEQGDHAFPKLVATLLPTGLRGIFLAAFLAALMSSIDSYLNAASAIVTYDLYKRFLRPNSSERLDMWVGRASTLILLAWAIEFAFFLMETGEGIYAIFQTMMSFFQGPALAILLAGVFWKRATGIAAFAGFVGGVLFSVILFSLSQESVLTALELQPLFQVEEPFLYFTVWAFLVAMVIVIAVSLISPPEPPEKLRYVIGNERGMKA